MKTKLGISAGLMAAATYFIGIASGQLAMLIIVGYVLIIEENQWLRRTSVKALIAGFLFNTLYTAVGLIPELISLIDSFLGFFDSYFSAYTLTQFTYFIQDMIHFAQMLVFIILGLKSLTMNDLPLKKVDTLVDKHLNHN